MGVITNVTRHTMVANRGVVAERLVTRLLGLLTRSSFDPGEALVFPRCNSIHTCFMRFPIDVIFLQQGCVVKAVQALKPFRLAWAAGADTVIELPAGTAAKTDTEVGTMLQLALIEPSRA